MQMFLDRKANLSAAKRALLEERLVGKGARACQAPAIVPLRRRDGVPLSYAQQRLWLADQLEPGNTSYNVTIGLRLTGKLDKQALSRAVNELIRRHEVLRTSFPEWGGTPVQEIAAESTLVPEEADLRNLGPAEGEQELRRLADLETSRPFDLARGPLLRLLLLQIADQEHALLFVMHHIVTDGWSNGILVREFAALYEAYCAGRSSPLPELEIQYADFAVWQRNRLTGEVLDTQLDYWKKQLAGVPLQELNTDHVQSAKRNHRGARLEIHHPAQTKDKLQNLGKQQGATLFMTLAAALHVLLSRYSGQSDVVIGTPIANRNQVETEALIGFFVNTLTLRSDLSADPDFRTLLSQVRQSTLDAYANQDVPFEKIVEELNPERRLSRTPLFRVMFAMQNAPTHDLNLNGLHVAGMQLRVDAAFDLTFIVSETSTGLTTSIVYDTDLFKPETIERMLTHWRILLEGIVRNPSARVAELPILTAAETQRMLAEWNRTAPLAHESRCIHQLFEEQAEHASNAIALEYEGERLTYAQLNSRSNQLAHHLLRLGVRPEEAVGLCLERSLNLIVSILGVLKAGAMYVPMDPRYPEDRLQYMLEDSRARVALVAEDTQVVPGSWAGRRLVIDADSNNLEREPSSNPNVAVSSGNAAYLIYTSGSTGLPKGVAVTHRNVTALFESTEPLFNFSAEDVWTLFHSYAFDFSVWEIWGALLYGGRLVVVPYWVSRSPEDFYALLRSAKVTILNQTPSAFQQLMRCEGALAAPERKLSLRRVIFGGEALEFRSLQPWFQRMGDVQPRLANMYGITETTVHVTFYDVGAADAANGRGSRIGRALPHLQAYVLDRNMGLVPVGTPGELYVGGAGLARGYMNRPDLTAERFVPNPYGAELGARLYRTGDQVRWQAEGALEYLGRLDQQVKIRGFRIELGEIEGAIAQFPGVLSCAVLGRDDEPGARILVAYVVAAEPGSLEVAELRHHVQQSLPEYMIPSAFVFLDALPLTPNGKTDRRALPALEQDRSASKTNFVAPRTPVEEALVKIWQDILGVKGIGLHDNFFALGGHSLSIVQLASRLRSTFHVDVPMPVLFDAPTIAEITAAIATAEMESAQAGEGSHLIEALADMTPEEVDAALYGEAS